MTTIVFLDETASAWDRTLYAFLAEKHRRSGSRPTVAAYSRMLNDFFARAAQTPDLVTSPDAFAWAYGTGASGREPSGVTIAARLACLSSYYRFLIRMKVVASNPADAIERPRISPGTARGLTGCDIRRLLAILPDTPVGLRDRAIILMLTFTGRRRSEVLGLTVGDLSFEDSVCFYAYRGKGGKTGRRELPQPALDALRAWLAATGRDLGTMAPPDSLWSSLTNGRGITSGTFYGNLQRYLKKAGLPLSGVHVFRHLAAKLRRDAGETIQEVSQFLDHSSLAVTTTYLRRLEGQEDRSWAKVAEAIGVSYES